MQDAASASWPLHPLGRTTRTTASDSWGTSRSGTLGSARDGDSVLGNHKGLLTLALALEPPRAAAVHGDGPRGQAASKTPSQRGGVPPPLQHPAPRLRDKKKRYLCLAIPNVEGFDWVPATAPSRIKWEPTADCNGAWIPSRHQQRGPSPICTRGMRMPRVHCSGLLCSQIKIRPAEIMSRPNAPGRPSLLPQIGAARQGAPTCELYLTPRSSFPRA